MFEIIQANGEALRFDDKHSWEYHTEECASVPGGIKEDRTVVVVRRVDENDDTLLVTTIFRPLRIDEVDANTTLSPMFRAKIGVRCVRCGHTEY